VYILRLCIVSCQFLARGYTFFFPVYNFFYSLAHIPRDVSQPVNLSSVNLRWSAGAVGGGVPFFLSLFLKTQPNHSGTKRMPAG